MSWAGPPRDSGSTCTRLSLPDEERSDIQNGGYEFMLQTMGWLVANSINSLGQDNLKRAAVFERLKRINPEAKGCTPTQSRLWSNIMDEFETLRAPKATRHHLQLSSCST